MQLARPVSFIGRVSASSRRRRTRFGCVSLFLVLVAVAGCSTVQVAYDNADWFLLRQMSRYMTLDGAQKVVAGELLEARMQTHRREELPLYVDALRTTRAMVADGLSEEEVDWMFERVTTLYQQTMRGTIPATTPVLASLTPKQIDHLEQVLREKNQDFEDEFIPASMDERHEGRTERAVEAIERWTGALSDAQTLLVARQRKAMPQTSEDWLAYNIGKQQQGLRLLRDGASEPELRRFLEAWWVEYADIPPELGGKLEKAMARWKILLVQIDRSASEKQRKRALRKLDGYIEDLSKLAQTVQATISDGRASGST